MPWRWRFYSALDGSPKRENPSVSSLRSATFEPAASDINVLWSFERNDKSLRLEMRHDYDTSEFVVIVKGPDGRERTERFTTASPARPQLVCSSGASRIDSQNRVAASALVLGETLSDLLDLLRRRLATLEVRATG